MADYGRLLDLADEVQHRASQFSECIRGASELHHRLLKFEQLRRAVEDTGVALRKYEHQRSREGAGEHPPKADKG